MNSIGRRATKFCAGGFAALWLLAAPPPVQAAESPRQANTGQLDSLAEGATYRVEPAVQSDGFFRIYTVATANGRYRVSGTELTKVFIQELKALEALDRMSKSDVFTKGLTRAAAAPVRFGVDLITNPGDTVERSVSGVANMFDRVNAGMANQKASRDSMVGSLLGVDEAKRELAVNLGVDPYTQFPPLAQKLTEIATATAGGGLTVKAALSTVPGAAGMAVSSVSNADAVKSSLTQKTSAQIVQDTKAALTRLNVPAQSITRFVENRIYTPADLLIMSNSLSRLNAKNTRIFIDMAAGAQTRDVAFFQRKRAVMLAEKSQELGGITEFVSVAAFPLNRTRGGEIVAAFPFDDLAWTETLERSAGAVSAELRRLYPSVSRRILATTASPTPMAASELQKLGWQVKTLN